ncbi:hypothetical protein [Microbacterium sp. 2FI]|uniref:hypothetical protein n=1 Tax=Microbacterium sp. 2FI TaxID=2502193 RepID=UPI0010F52CD2|nr:hypothetical protein [Microbacterium sp. 2FI]
MIAPVLAPREQDEARRFGIHDEDVLDELAEHRDDEPECCLQGHPAASRLVTTCCGNAVLTCRLHLQAHLIWAEAQLLLSAGVRCAGCGREFRFPTSVEDILREVPL